MTGTDSENIDLESTDRYLRSIDDSLLGLEPVEVYVRRVKAEIRLSKARTANWVAYILVSGLVASLPLYVLVACLANQDSATQVAGVFDKWYDVVAPLLGVVIGTLFGMRIAGQRKDEMD